MGTLDRLPEQGDTLPQTSRVDKLTAITAPTIKAELDAILELGWYLNGIYDIGANTFAVFTRPKRQV
jgi:hypothetical protein